MSNICNFEIQPIAQQHSIKICRKSGAYSVRDRDNEIVDKIYFDGCVYEYSRVTKENTYIGKIPTNKLQEEK